MGAVGDAIAGIEDAEREVPRSVQLDGNRNRRVVAPANSRTEKFPPLCLNGKNCAAHAFGFVVNADIGGEAPRRSREEDIHFAHGMDAQTFSEMSRPDSDRILKDGLTSDEVAPAFLDILQSDFFGRRPNSKKCVPDPFGELRGISRFHGWRIHKKRGNLRGIWSIHRLRRVRQVFTPAICCG